MATQTSTAAGRCVLVRYGAMGEVGRFAAGADAVPLGSSVVIETSRGREVGTIIAEAAPISSEDDQPRPLIRPADDSDLDESARLREQCQQTFGEWEDRIRQWNVDVQLIDIEQTLEDGKQILYVLNQRGPETTKLALKAAAAGLGVIEVQPVGLDGVIDAAPSGGCGSCGHGH